MRGIQLFGAKSFSCHHVPEMNSTLQKLHSDVLSTDANYSEIFSTSSSPSPGKSMTSLAVPLGYPHVKDSGTEGAGPGVGH